MKFNVEIIRPSKTTVEKKAFILKVNPINKLDQDNSDEFEFILLTMAQGGLCKVLLDMDELRYVDSSGIGKIISLTKVIRSLEGNLAVAQCTTSVAEVFKLVHLEKFVQYV